MKAITIHPESLEQFEMVKAVLKALKVPFEPQSTSLPKHIENSVSKSLEEFESGHTISMETFKRKHFKKR